MSNSNKLMFQIGINNVTEEIARVKKELEQFSGGAAIPVSLKVSIANAADLQKQIEEAAKSLKMPEYERQIAEQKAQLEELAKAYAKLVQAKGEAARQGKALDNTGSERAYLRNYETLQYKMQEVLKRISSAQDVISKNQGLSGFDPQPLERYIAQLQSLHAQMQVVLQDKERLSKTGALTTPTAVGESSILGRGNSALISVQALNEATKKSVQGIREQAQTEREAARAAKEHAVALQNLAKEYSNVTKEAGSQGRVLSDLKTMALQYLSVWGGQQFLSNIIEIGGQLEMQRLSIGAILQDTAHANELFGRIKALAVQSPFGVVELDSFTKQLSAYGFKYNELYDMTKRLADIAAGAGTQVSRLALALGHVRAESALSGYTLRQFAMNNIPMVGKLSELLTEREGRKVTVSEVRQRTSKKEIGYEDVVQVIKDLTNEGGMFYNMQETISESVKAKYKNLRDSMDIMYGEMAESGIGDMLKWIAEQLLNLTTHWQQLISALGGVAAAFGVGKVAMMVWNNALGAGTGAVLNSIQAQSRHMRSQLQLAQSYRTLSASETAMLASSKNMTATYAALAISEGRLTREQLARAIAMGKISKATARMAVDTANLSAKEQLLYYQTIKTTKVLSGWQRVGVAIQSTFGRISAAIRGLLVSMGPMVAISAAIGAIAALWSKNSQEKEFATNMGESFRNRAEEGVKNIRTAMQDLDAVYRKDGKEVEFGGLHDRGGGKIEFKASVSLDTNALVDDINRMRQFIQEYGSVPNKLINDAAIDKETGKTKDLRSEYEALTSTFNTVAEAYRLMRQYGDEWLKDANDATNGGIFDEDLNTNVKDWSEAARKYNKNIVDTIQTLGEERVLSYLQTLKSKYKGLAAKVQEKEKELGRGLTTVEAARVASENGYLYNTSLNELKNAEREAESDWEKFLDCIKTRAISEEGMDFTKLTDVNVEFLRHLVVTQFNGMTGLTDEMKKKFIELTENKWSITFDINADEISDRVNSIKDNLTAITGHVWRIEVKATDSMTDTISSTRDAHKKWETLSKSHDYDELRKLAGIDGLTAWDIVERTTLENGGVDYTGIQPPSILDEEKLAEMKRYINEVVDAAHKEINAQDLSGWLKYSLDESDKKSGSGGKGTYKNEFARRWDEQIRILKEAYQWYDKWNDKIGDTAALEKVQQQYAEIFDEWKGFADASQLSVDIRDIPNYKKYIEQIRDKAQAQYNEQRNDKSKNNGEEALRVLRQATSLLEEISMTEFEQESSRYLSRMKRELDDVTRKWEIFNAVRQATGDVALASRMTDVDGRRHAFRVQELRDSIEAKWVGDNPGLSAVANLDDQGIRDFVIGNTETEGRFKGAATEAEGVIQLLKQWRDLQRDLTKEAATAYANLLGESVNYAVQVAKINDEYEQTIQYIEWLRDIGLISSEDAEKARALAGTKRSSEALKASNEYQNFFGGVYSMLERESDAMAATIKDNLLEQFKNGRITAKQYADEIKKVNEQLAKRDAAKGGFLTFLDGGVKGLLQRKYDKASGEYDQGAANYEKAKEAGDADGMAVAEEQMRAADEQMQAAKGQMAAVEMTQKIVGEINGFIQGVSESFNSIRDMGDALGWDVGEDTVWGDIGAGLDALSGFSGGISSAVNSAMSGDVGGVLSGVVGAFTSPITALAKHHDNKLAAKIEKLQKEVTKIENNTASVSSALDRQLGYSTSNPLSSYYQMYEEKYRASRNKWFFQTPETMALKDMMSYYGYNYSSGDSGYMQEYKNLLQEREDYMRMLADEEAKKKSDSDAIEEYKSQIASLDEEILYFTEDLANELWGIDLTSWSDQLSDALCTAFENGENAADAYADSVTSIMQSLASQMMSLQIIQPMMEQLEKILFGEMNENGEKVGGVVDLNDMEGSAKAITKAVASFFGENGAGTAALTGAQEFLDSFEEALNEVGLTLKNDTSETLGSSVSGITEETADILAGYVNALRQDVAVIRLQDNTFYTETFPNMVEVLTGGMSALSSIDTNVQAIRSIISENGALYNKIDDIYAKLNAVTNGTQQFHVA